MAVEVAGFMMNYVDQGYGTPTLLIHGFPLNHKIWEPQLTGLEIDSRVVAPDLRGFGSSDPVPGIYPMDVLAQDCATLLDELGVHVPIVVGGVSMGGYVTFAFYRLFPERVAGLILVSTRPGADSPEAKANRDRLEITAMEEGAPGVTSEMLPKMLAPSTYSRNPELVARLQDIMDSASTEGLVGAIRGMKERPDSTPLLAKIDKPTLILHGADDQIIPVSEAEKMKAGIQNSVLQVIPDAGHLPNMEQPDLFNRAVEKFIESM